MPSQNTSGLIPKNILEKVYYPYKFTIVRDVMYDLVRIYITDPDSGRIVDLQITSEVLESCTPQTMSTIIRKGVNALKAGKRGLIKPSIYPYFNPSSRKEYDN